MLKDRLLEMMASAPDIPWARLLPLAHRAAAELVPGRELHGEVRSPGQLAALFTELTAELLDAGANTLARREAQLAKMRAKEQLTGELLALASQLARPRDVLRESAEVVRRFLGGELCVSRMRRDNDLWELVWASSSGAWMPIMERNLAAADHPVLALAEANKTIHSQLAAELHTGQGAGTTAQEYERPYRSRLALILRHADGEPFAVIFVYAIGDTHFDDFRRDFFEDLGRILTLSVGRRLDLTTDTLTKTAGGLAHIGNNILAIITQNLDLADELLDFGKPEEVRDAIVTAKRASWRMAACLADLFDLAKRPRLVDYLDGRQVLDLQTKDWERRKA